MNATHQLLVRQLRRLGLAPDAVVPPPWDALLAHVDAAYHDADQDRQLLERSLSISFDELRTLYEDLERSSATQLAAERDQLRAITAVQAAVMEASPAGLLVLPPSGYVQFINQRFLEIWGLAETQVLGARGHDVLTTIAGALAEPRAFVAAILALLAAPASRFAGELKLRDGRTVEISVYPANDPAEVTRAQCWRFLDITARQRDRQRLADAHAFLDSIVETIPSVVFVKDATTLRFLGVNRAGEMLLGRPRDEILGKTDADLFPAPQAAELAEADQEALLMTVMETMTDTETELALMTPFGTRHVRIRRTPIYAPDGWPRYLLAVADDTSAQRAHEAELFLAKEHAERASRAKSDFLLNMSHELRTPLNAILGFARVLARTARDRLTEDEQGFLADVVGAGDHMLQLVNDLLDLRSLEAVGLDRSEVDLLGAIDEAVKMATPLATERNQRLTLEVARDLPMGLGARRAVVQVLVNLLTNAIKFTPDGGTITLGATRVGAMVALHVRDTGPGIALADQARLFVYFEQLGGKHAHHMRGSGVGLALTRALVERMGGTIAVSSDLGAGATFTVNLQAAEKA